MDFEILIFLDFYISCGCRWKVFFIGVNRKCFRVLRLRRRCEKVKESFVVIKGEE